MKIERREISRIDHCPVYEITMFSKKDAMVVKLLSYGASIWQILLPNQQGILEHVVLGYYHPEKYWKNPLFAGAFLGPTSGRISRGNLTIDGCTFQLSQNDGIHNLHGGYANLSYKNWDVAQLQEDTDFCSVTFSTNLENGVDGFPGNRYVEIHYTLWHSNLLEIKYFATTDRTTYFNLSNHSYFNLSGDSTRSALLQELHMDAADYITNDAEHIPMTIKSCLDTPFDFSTPRTLLSNINSDPKNQQLMNAQGYNHGFLLSPSSAAYLGIKKALSLKDNASGRMLSIYTDAPCIVVYSGGYIDRSHLLSSQVFSSPSCAIALEAQDIPDVSHICPQNFSVTRAGELYTRMIIYEFQMH